ncbi:hypothetical protein LJC46_06915, partial [Desulfovibrio sp. OttesenSCG-928-G15]|nr:hypothetical protein [Desulfovibrio sp. OttesenSCG-928-G15]
MNAYEWLRYRLCKKNVALSSTYGFLHKLIRNSIPGKNRQQRCIDCLRQFFFPVILADKRITPDGAVCAKTATKRVLGEAVHLPAPAILAPEGYDPAQELREHSVPPCMEYILERGYAYRNFVLDSERSFVVEDVNNPFMGHK